MYGGGGLTYESPDFGAHSGEPPPSALAISSGAVGQEWIH